MVGAVAKGVFQCRHCADDLGMEVVGLDDYSSGTTNVPFLSDIRIVKGDLSNSTFLAGLFAKHHFDIVYHTSQLGGSSLSHHQPSRIYETNLVRSDILHDCCHVLVDRISHT